MKFPTKSLQTDSCSDAGSQATLAIATERARNSTQILGKQLRAIMSGERGKSYEGAAPPSPTQLQRTGGKRVALVIGNAHYDHGKHLVNPHNDAAAAA